MTLMFSWRIRINLYWNLDVSYCIFVYLSIELQKNNWNYRFSSTFQPGIQIYFTKIVLGGNRYNTFKYIKHRRNHSTNKITPFWTHERLILPQTSDNIGFYSSVAQSRYRTTRYKKIMLHRQNHNIISFSKQSVLHVYTYVILYVARLTSHRVSSTAVWLIECGIPRFEDRFV